MIRGGKGGANTNKTGLEFERATSLADALNANGFLVDGSFVLSEGKKVGQLIEKAKLYKFLDAAGVDWEKLISSRLLPDEACFSIGANSVTIVEKKWQEVSGSVDEKLQTCGFKIRQYKRLFEPIDVDVKYVYLLNDWFAHPRYQDVLDYIREVGAEFHFRTLPLELLDLR
jgi:hypothetical protein